MHALDLGLPPFGVIPELHVALAAHVLGGDFHVILAPVGLAQLQHGELGIGREVVAVVEYGDLAWLLVDGAHGPLCVVLDEVALEGHGGSSEHLEVLPVAEGQGTRDDLELSDLEAI